jgi:FkbM family methyltransferase
MYSDFSWTRVSAARIAILKRLEPLQPFVLSQLARHLGIETFVDVGANVGVYSLFLSSVPSMSRVLSFEPAAKTLYQLKQNVALNAAEKVEVFDVALSDRQTTVDFGIAGDYSGANSIVQGSIHHKGTFTTLQRVSTSTLDSVFGDQMNRRIALKIDVEGHEKQALLGSANLLTRNTVLLQIEIYQGRSEVSELLESWGFRKLFHLGPDCYYANTIEPSDADIRCIFEEATAALIRDNLRADFAPDRSAAVSLLPGVDVVLSGSAALNARGVIRALTVFRDSVFGTTRRVVAELQR